jgi:hypothetical protein
LSCEGHTNVTIRCNVQGTKVKAGSFEDDVAVLVYLEREEWVRRTGAEKLIAAEG